MSKRFFFVAMMAVFLVAGMVSSAACELLCIPAAGTTACCPQQMQKSASHAAVHAMSHCKGAASWMDAHQCDHPQDGTTLPAIASQAIQPHATENISTPLTALPDASLMASSPGDSSLFGFSRSSFSAPLRI